MADCSIHADPQHRSLADLYCILYMIQILISKALTAGMVQLKQDAVRDSRPRFRCRHLANWTKQRSARFWPICSFVWNMTSSKKPEVHNILQCCQRRTEPRPKIIAQQNRWNLDLRLFRYANDHRQTDRQTDRHTDRNTSLTYRGWGWGKW